MIVKRGNKYQLISRKSDRVLGTHDTRREAINQEYAIQKNMDEGGMVDWPEEQGPISFDELLARQVYKESRGNPLAESPAGAKGLAQFRDITIDHMKSKGWVDDDFDPFNPEDALAAQRKYMGELMGRSWNKGSDEVRMAKALVAYNWGPTATVRMLNEAKAKGIDIYNSLDWLEEAPLESRDYAQKILGYNDKFMGEYDAYSNQKR